MQKKARHVSQEIDLHISLAGNNLHLCYRHLPHSSKKMPRNAARINLLTYIVV